MSSAEATLTCYIGGARPLVITPGNITRVYGETDAMSYTVSGLVDGDAASNVVSGSLGRASGDDVGTYAINMGTLALTPAYATKYALPDSPTVATYTITPKAAAYTATGVNKQYDGTTAPPASLGGSFAAGDILSGDTVTVSGGSYPSADVGTGLAITGSSVGGADAGNYSVTLSVSGDITPRTITAISGVRVNSRVADGTTDATFDTGSAQGTGVLAGELADFRAGGLAVSGAFPSAAAGSLRRERDLFFAGSRQFQGKQLHAGRRHRRRHAARRDPERTGPAPDADADPNTHAHANPHTHAVNSRNMSDEQRPTRGGDCFGGPHRGGVHDRRLLRALRAA